MLAGLAFASLLLWRYADAESGRDEEKAFGSAQRIVAAIARELVGIRAAAQALAAGLSRINTCRLCAVSA